MAQKKAKKPAKTAKEAGLTEQLLLLEKKNLKIATKQLRKDVIKHQRKLRDAVKSACERLNDKNSAEDLELINILDACAEAVVVSVQDWSSFDTTQGFSDGRYAAIVSTDLALVPELLTLAIRVVANDEAEAWMTISAEELVSTYYTGHFLQRGSSVNDFLSKAAMHGDPKEDVYRLSTSINVFMVGHAISWLSSLGVTETCARTSSGDGFEA